MGLGTLAGDARFIFQSLSRGREGGREGGILVGTDQHHSAPAPPPSRLPLCLHFRPSTPPSWHLIRGLTLHTLSQLSMKFIFFPPHLHWCGVQGLGIVGQTPLTAPLARVFTHCPLASPRAVMTRFLVAGDESLCHIELHHEPSACVQPPTGQLEHSWSQGLG